MTALIGTSRAFHTWTFTKSSGKNLVRNLQYGPRTWLVRGTSIYRTDMTLITKSQLVRGIYYFFLNIIVLEQSCIGLYGSYDNQVLVLSPSASLHCLLIQ